MTQRLQGLRINPVTETRNLERWPTPDSVSANFTRNDEAAPQPARFRVPATDARR